MKSITSNRWLTGAALAVSAGAAATLTAPAMAHASPVDAGTKAHAAAQTSQNAGQLRAYA